jgi:hypothetical protein
MTIGTVSQTLNDLAGVLESADAMLAGKTIRTVSAFLQPYASETAAAFFKRAKPTVDIGCRNRGEQVRNVEKLLVAFLPLVDRVANKTIAKEFRALLAFFTAHRDAGLSDLLEASNIALSTPPATSKKKQTASKAPVVNEYIKRLQTAFASDREFESVISELEANKGARKQEVVEIASRITNEPCINLDRKKALQAIRDVHKASRSFDLKLRAMSGRSAA